LQDTKYCCDKFQHHVKQWMTIEYHNYNWSGWRGADSGAKGWYFNTCDDDQFEVKIDYCPFCGVKL